MRMLMLFCFSVYFQCIRSRTICLRVKRKSGNKLGNFIFHRNSKNAEEFAEFGAQRDVVGSPAARWQLRHLVDIPAARWPWRAGAAAFPAGKRQRRTVRFPAARWPLRFDE